MGLHALGGLSVAVVFKSVVYIHTLNFLQVIKTYVGEYLWNTI